MSQFLTLAKKRRSIQPVMFDDVEISKEDILKILEAAHWAPSHKKIFPWRFIVFGGDAKEDLAEFVKSNYQKLAAPEKFSEMKQKKFGKKIMQSSHIIALISKESGELPAWEDLAATSSAIQNLWLAATDMGYGGYWSSPSFVCKEKKFFDCTENESCLGLFYLGKPKDGLQLPASRPDLMDYVSFR